MRHLTQPVGAGLPANNLPGTGSRASPLLLGLATLVSTRRNDRVGVRLGVTGVGCNQLNTTDRKLAQDIATRTTTITIGKP